MVDKTTTILTAASTLDGTELAYLVQGGNSRKVTTNRLVGEPMHAATGKTTPVDADEMGLLDSAASFVLKKVTLTNFKAFLKTYFDTLYNAIDANTLKSNVAANLTKGFTGTANNAGTKSSGTFTPDPADGNLQRAVNGGAHTLAPPSVGGGDSCQVTIQYTNNGSAGTITTSGFTKVTGSSLTTVNGDDFLFYCTVINGFSVLNVVALQ